MERGAQPGNANATKGKPWREAIDRALARAAEQDDFRSLNRLADKLLEKAGEGDLGALKELGDRLDGRPAQSVTLGGDAENPVRLEQIVRKIVDPHDRDAPGV